MNTASETELRSQLASALSSEKRLRAALRALDAASYELENSQLIPFLRDKVGVALATPFPCPDLVLVGREEWERIQKQVTEAGLKGGGE